MRNDQCLPPRSISDQPVRPQTNKFVHFISDTDGSDVDDKLVAPNDVEPEVDEEEQEDNIEEDVEIRSEMV